MRHTRRGRERGGAAHQDRVPGPDAGGDCECVGHGRRGRLGATAALELGTSAACIRWSCGCKGMGSSLQGVGSSEARVLVLGATNLPYGLDQAVRRRFDKVGCRTSSHCLPQLVAVEHNVLLSATVTCCAPAQSACCWSITSLSHAAAHLHPAAGAQCAGAHVQSASGRHAALDHAEGKTER